MTIAIIAWLAAGGWVLSRCKRNRLFAWYSPEDATAIALVIVVAWPIPVLATRFPRIAAPIDAIGRWLGGCGTSMPRSITPADVRTLRWATDHLGGFGGGQAREILDRLEASVGGQQDEDLL
jgi:hypothetical protein